MGASTPSYTIVGQYGVFFRIVGGAEFQQWRQSRRLEPEPGGMAFGKHLTTTAELAMTWGRLFVEREWEDELGRVLKVELALSVAGKLHYYPKLDGIGPAYFATFGQLVGARITEVNLEA